MRTISLLVVRYVSWRLPNLLLSFGSPRLPLAFPAPVLALIVAFRRPGVRRTLTLPLHATDAYPALLFLCELLLIGHCFVCAPRAHHFQTCSTVCTFCQTLLSWRRRHLPVLGWYFSSCPVRTLCLGSPWPQSLALVWSY